MRRTCGDSGAADAVGMAMIAPAMIGLALVIMFLGRGVDGRATVHGAAESAAQAAARERTAGAAIRAAERIGSAMLVDDTSCASPRFRVDVSDFTPGGVVGVTVSCRSSTAGVELVARRGHTYSATAFAAIDTFRATGDGP